MKIVGGDLVSFFKMDHSLSLEGQPPPQFMEVTRASNVEMRNGK